MGDASETLAIEIALDREQSASRRSMKLMEAAREKGLENQPASFWNRLLCDPDVMVQRTALAIFADHGCRSDELIDLIFMIANSDSINRAHAIQALGKCEDGRVFSSCSSLFEVGTIGEQIASVVVLGEIGTQEAIALLQEMFGKTRNPCLKTHLACSLCQCGDVATLPYLKLRLKRMVNRFRIPLMSWLWGPNAEEILIACVLSNAGDDSAAKLLERIAPPGTTRKRLVDVICHRMAMQQAPPSAGNYI